MHSKLQNPLNEFKKIFIQLPEFEHYSNNLEQKPKIQINIPSHIDLTENELNGFKPFNSWFKSIGNSLNSQYNKTSLNFVSKKNPYILNKIEIQSVDKFQSGNSNPHIGFIKLKCFFNEKNPLPGIVFLRGTSVAVLILLRSENNDNNNNTNNNKPDEPFVVLTCQPRIPTGYLNLVEIPAGMFDDSNSTLSGAAVREIKEECGISIPVSDLIPLNSDSNGIYLSPGGSDEQIHFYLYEKKLSLQEINKLQNKLGGLRNEGENITLKILPYKNVWESTRDAKTLCALALYEKYKSH